MGRYDLRKRKTPSTGRIVLLSMLVGVLVAGGWSYWQEIRSELSPQDSRQQQALALPEHDEREDESDRERQWLDIDIPSDGDSEAVPLESLPALKESDAYFGEKLERAAPQLSVWLQTPQTIRKIVLIINDFAQSQRLYKHIRPFKLKQPFEVAEDEQGFYIPPQSYQRYDELVAAIDSANVQELVDLYRKIKPLGEEVFAEFGYPDDYRLDDLVKKAGAEILSAPVIDQRIDLSKPSVLYRFADDRLEKLNPVHKQMLRMGPRNTRIIQNKIRLLIEALIEDQDVQ